MIDKDQWQPIETAPKDGTVLLTFPHYRVTHWSVDECMSFSHAGWAGRWDEYTETFAVIIPTHWMPLPPAPTKDTTQ